MFDHEGSEEYRGRPATGRSVFGDREAQPIDLVWFQEYCVAYEKNTRHLQSG